MNGHRPMKAIRCPACKTDILHFECFECGAVTCARCVDGPYRQGWYCDAHARGPYGDGPKGPRCGRCGGPYPAGAAGLCRDCFETPEEKGRI